MVRRFSRQYLMRYSRFPRPHRRAARPCAAPVRGGAALRWALFGRIHVGGDGRRTAWCPWMIIIRTSPIRSPGGRDDGQRAAGAGTGAGIARGKHGPTDSRYRRPR